MRDGILEAFDRLEKHERKEADITGEGIELAMELDLRTLEAGISPVEDQETRERLLGRLRSSAGRKGGKETFLRYGSPYYRALARVRWGQTPAGALPGIRAALGVVGKAHEAHEEKELAA